MYGGLQLNGIPDLSYLRELDFSNLNLPQPAPAPVPAPTPEPVQTPTPAFDPYAGMTQADLAEIGMMAPLPQTLPAPAPVSQPVAPTGIETMAPNFQMTEDFALPVDQQALMPATAPVQAPAQTPPLQATEPTVNEVAQNLVSAGNFYTDGQMADMGIEPGTLTTPSGRVLDEVRATEDVFIPPDEYITAASDYYTDGQLAEMGIEPGTAVSTGANPQQPTGTPVDLTPDQQAAIDNFLANNPAGSVIETPFGNVSLPELGQYTGGNTAPTTNVDAARYVIQNLVPQASETARGGRVATTFGGPVNVPQQAPQASPFRRPTDEGIASLAPSGG